MRLKYKYKYKKVQVAYYSVEVRVPNYTTWNAP